MKNVRKSIFSMFWSFLSHKSITTWVSEIIAVQSQGFLECYLKETYLNCYQCVVVFEKNAWTITKKLARGAVPLKCWYIIIYIKGKPVEENKKATGFCFFSKVFSWETDLWVTLGNFTVKKLKIGKGNLFLTENLLSRNEMWCVTDTHNYMRHSCAKGFSDSNFG